MKQTTRKLSTAVKIKQVLCYNLDVTGCTTNAVFFYYVHVTKRNNISSYKQHLNSTILSQVHNGCLDFIIEMANALHLMGNASELDKLIQSFGKSITENNSF